MKVLEQRFREKKTGKVILKKCHIAHLASLKCAESNHYNNNNNSNNNCLLYHRCWLLCTSYGEYRAARTCGVLNGGALPGIFLIPLREQLRQ